ncbi:MAG: proton extrusion protein PcxA [Arthrospira sp. SH-MAG29]|nr:proton extrusion protein PcxA [Arthrospira sp. SH-MAG29]MBS0016628.1 proton extrusion protein PcxA [Arthrospira sp. SH-MAG29]
MTSSNWTQFKRFLNRANQWFRDTPDRALDQAYDAALKIRSLENEHFHGEAIGSSSDEYSDRVLSYFKSEVNKYLQVIQMRLAEFNTSRSILGISEQIDPAELNRKLRNPDDIYDRNYDRNQDADTIDIICEKLEFIDAVTNRYQKKPSPKKVTSPSKSLVKVEDLESRSLIPNQPENELVSLPTKSKSILSSDIPISPPKAENNLKDNLKSENSGTSFLPRTLLRTVTRIKRELNPESEEQVIKDYRKSKVKTIIAIRFILILILVPLLTQQLSKNFVISPFVDRFWVNENTPLFMNVDMEEEALMEIERYESRLKFEMMVGLIPELTPEEFEERTQAKAIKIAEEYRSLSANSIKNIFADIISVFTFVLILSNNKPEVQVVKSFMGDIIYGLSDSAKAFILILLTDMFVGFHSPHGWEVILESVARHFGVAESRDFNFLFIATFPVILDAVFKYWIFRYLNRSSPSAVSTYKTMNE